MAVERSPDEIQRDIEQARISLANTVDQISYRTNPKRVRENVKQTLMEAAQTPRGKAVMGAAGAVFALMLIRRARRARLRKRRTAVPLLSDDFAE